MKNDHDDFCPTNLGEALRKYRLRTGLTQKSVSEALGISRSAYTYYETGKTSPDPTMLFRIACMFDVPLDLFFDEGAGGAGASEKLVQQRGILGCGRELGQIMGILLLRDFFRQTLRALDAILCKVAGRE